MSCYCLSTGTTVYSPVPVCSPKKCTNTMHTYRPLSLCCITMSCGVKFCSLKALPLKVEVVKLPSCLSHSEQTKGVCECTCIQLFLADLINPLSRLTPHCHSLLRTHTHTQTRTYILHAVFIGLNDRGDSFPCGKRGGTSCQHGPLHLSSHTTQRGREKTGSWKWRGRWRWLNERLIMKD